jgi:hypothetical protein
MFMLTRKRVFFFAGQRLQATAVSIWVSTTTRFPSEISSHRPLSPTYEQGESTKRIPVVDLSSDEEDIFPDTSRDEEFSKRLFGDLNCGLLGMPGNGNVIILNDSDEEEELREEDTADAEDVPSSVVNSRPQPPLLLMPMMHLMGCKMIVMVAAPLIRSKMIVAMVGMCPVVDIFCTGKNRVVKIMHSSFKMVLRTMKYTMIYPGSGPSLEVIALCPVV